MLLSPAKPTLVPVGEALPDFELVDQNQNRVSLSSLRGRVVAVNFIYSRCPLPDYCPRMVDHFKEVSERFGARLESDLVLLTVSFDPKFDTPDVLRSYAKDFGAERKGWHFLTGSLEAIDRVCAAFGIEYWPDEGLLTHSLQTAVIDREGRLAATIEGKDFSGKQLGDLLEAVLEQNGRERRLPLVFGARRRRRVRFDFPHLRQVGIGLVPGLNGLLEGCPGFLGPAKAFECGGEPEVGAAAPRLALQRFSISALRSGEVSQ